MRTEKAEEKVSIVVSTESYNRFRACYLTLKKLIIVEMQRGGN
jgi:hypothetical protein